ncbi:MAG: hypothetical protein ABFC80_05385 [Coriobacteriales bacterium]|nr:hypothetical protein [Actinomycetes bacterium]
MATQERREPRGFEPPPWEREAFERFRQQQAEQKKDAELDEALAAVLGAQQVAGEPHQMARSVEAVLAASENEKASDDDTTSEGEREAARVVSQAWVERMLVDLKIEETAPTKDYKVVSSVVSGLLLAGGLGFVIWSAVLFARTRTTEGAVAVASPVASATASALMMLWGFMLVGGAVLLWRKYNVR